MRRRLVLMLAMAAGLVFCGALANYLLNPYGAWNTALIDPIFRKPKDEHVALPFVVRRADLATLLVGTSRVVFGMRIDSLAANGFVNGGIRAASLRESCAIVDAALANPHLKRIVWELDFFQFDRSWDADNPEFERRVKGGAGTVIEDALLSLAALDNGMNDLKRMMRGRARLPDTARTEVPWPPEVICREYAAQLGRGLVSTPAAAIIQQISVNMPNYQNYHFSQNFWDRFRATIAAAQRRGVMVILFVPPMSEYELEVIRHAGQWDEFERWKRRLVAIAPVIDFSGYNRLARADDYYSDVMHHKTPIGESLLRILLGMPVPACYGIGENLRAADIHLDTRDIDDAIVAQNRMMREASMEDSRYGRVAVRALAEQRARTRARQQASVLP
ncbi:MAG TPA: hypothetical protein VMD75_04280 [Candidatus Binataceae bacterium]|nr:hypothetical protein [Candidatus Binataceae bacterium]